MLFATSNSLEEHIITLLGEGPLKNTELIERVNLLRPHTTKQAVYTTLRNLKAEEIIVAHGMGVSLNVRWLGSMENYLVTAKQKYHAGSTDKGSFAALKNGERIEYFFNDLIETDAFWWQALYQLTINSSTGEPVYLYNPHQWFLLARRKSELESMASIVNHGKQYFVTSCGKTALDKKVAVDFDGEQSQYYMSEKHLFNKINYYFNVVDDFIIEVWINSELAQNIENLYTSTDLVTDETIDKLKSIVSVKGKGKMVISKNISKTERLKKKLSKHFYIKK